MSTVVRTNDEVLGEKKTMTVGYWVTGKKFERIDINKFKTLCEKEGINVKELNLELELEPQGPFHVILHRVSDLISQQKDGDRVAAALLGKFKQYLHRHPETIVLDPLSAVRKLSHRFKMCKIIREKIAFDDVQVPPFVRIQDPREYTQMVKKIRKAGLSFPLLGKPCMAHDHNLMLIFNERGLSQLQRLRPPVLLQNYVPHNGVLYKINVIGIKSNLLTRPSIRNLTNSNREPVMFHTHDISKPGCQTALNLPPDARTTQAAQIPDIHKISKLVKKVKDQLNLALFGIDMILEAETNRHYIIDMNHFPGFEGVSEVPERLLEIVKMNLQVAQRRKIQIPQSAHSSGASTASEITESASVSTT